MILLPLGAESLNSLTECHGICSEFCGAILIKVLGVCKEKSKAVGLSSVHVAKPTKWQSCSTRKLLILRDPGHSKGDV